MKAWIKYLLAAAIGFLYVHFIPYLTNDIEWLVRSSRLIASAVPFILYPMVLITLSAGLGALIRQQNIWKSIGLSMFWGITASAVVTLAAAAFLFFSPLPPFPAMDLQESAALQLLPTGEFPASASPDAFSGPISVTLFGIMILAFFIGGNLNPQQNQIKPAYAVFNSLAELFYKISWCLTELLTIAVLFFAGAWFSLTRSIDLFAYPYSLFLLAVIIGIMIFFILLPLSARVFHRNSTPYRWMLFSAPAFIAAFFSGSTQTALLPLYTVSRHNIGAAKRVTSTTIPVIHLFGRGGTAVVSMLLLTVLLQSHQGAAAAAGAGTISLLTIAAVSFAASFLSILTPGAEILFTLIMAARLLGIDLIPSLFMIIPVLPLLRSIGSMIDILITALGTGCIADKERALAQIPWNETV